MAQLGSKREKMKKLFTVVLLVVAVLCIGCSESEKINKEGDTVVIDLPPGEKLINFASSRYDDYVTYRTRHQDEYPEEYKVDRINKSSHERKNKHVIIREH